MNNRSHKISIIVCRQAIANIAERIFPQVIKCDIDQLTASNIELVATTTPPYRYIYAYFEDKLSKKGYDNILDLKNSKQYIKILLLLRSIILQGGNSTQVTNNRSTVLNKLTHLSRQIHIAPNPTAEHYINSKSYYIDLVNDKENSTMLPPLTRAFSNVPSTTIINEFLYQYLFKLHNDGFKKFNVKSGYANSGQNQLTISISAILQGGNNINTLKTYLDQNSGNNNTIIFQPFYEDFSKCLFNNKYSAYGQKCGIEVRFFCVKDKIFSNKAVVVKRNTRTSSINWLGTNIHNSVTYPNNRNKHKLSGALKLATRARSWLIGKLGPKIGYTNYNPIFLRIDVAWIRGHWHLTEFETASGMGPLGAAADKVLPSIHMHLNGRTNAITGVPGRLQ
jgi:hypothetical protein